MIRISTSWSYQQSLTTMLGQQAALANTQNQVSTGLRINVASDDPGGAAQAVDLNHLMDGYNTYSSNINAANTQLSTANSALQSVGTLLDSVNDLALQGINGALSATNRASMASQLSGLEQQLIQLTNTTGADGSALFAGTSTTTTPFVQNSDGSVSYNGNGQAAYTAVGEGLQVETSTPGDSLFMNIPAGNGSFVAGAGSSNTGSLVVGNTSVTDATAWDAATAGGAANYTITFGANGSWAATDATTGAPLTDSSGNPITGTYQDGGSISFNGMSLSLSGTPAAGDTVSVKSGTTQDVFTTINNMITALQSNDSSTQLSNTLNQQIQGLSQAKTAVTNAQVDIGGRINILTQESDTYSNLNLTYTKALSGVQDADTASVISNLSLQSAALQASQQVFAKVNSMSLFNYLQS